MSTTSGPIYSLLPAVFRTNDALQGSPLAALFSVLENQYGIVCDNLQQLYDDQFIETCAPWVIPYIGELIGYDPVYTVALSSPDSRAEVANTIGYRRRKGTLLALEQVTHDVSGRTTIAIEEFRRLVTTLSLRDVRPHHNTTANLRRGRDWEDRQGPFTRLNHIVDVRRITPGSRPSQSPDPTPLDMALHGSGRFNISEVAVWLWRCQSRAIANAPAFDLGGGGYFFSALGGPIPLFQQPPPAPLPFARLMNEGDAPQPISRRRFAEELGAFYPGSIELIADGLPVDGSQIVCANLTERSGGAVCLVPAGKIAIDPVLGRIQYAQNLTPPTDLRVNYSYGSPAEMGGGPYDRSTGITQPVSSVATFSAVVGTALYPTLEEAVAAWNQQQPGAAGTILLPNFEAYTINLTGTNAIQLPAQSQLLIASAEISAEGAPPEFINSCVTLRGNIEVVGLPAPLLPNGQSAPVGQMLVSGIWLSGEVQLMGEAFCLQIVDSTLTPGRTLTTKGEGAFAGEPSVSGSAIGATLCMTRVISGPIALPTSCSVRVCTSVVDSSSPYCVAYGGPELASAGAGLHIEDSTVVGKVWTQALRLASNTLFYARLGRHDPWKAAVWASRRQVGCVRFCWLPPNSITPRQYECLPPDASSEPALEPTFITRRFGEPGYCLLSGDVPMAIWKGADNGSQMGVYLAIQETEAVTNVQIRSMEYLPANLERGVFIIPSRALHEPIPDRGPYGGRRSIPRCTDGVDMMDEAPFGIGIGLI